MFTLAIQTGLRISELIGLTLANVHTGTGAHVHCLGKGRKERRTPLLPTTLSVLGSWIDEQAAGGVIPAVPQCPVMVDVIGQGATL